MTKIPTIGCLGQAESAVSKAPDRITGLPARNEPFRPYGCPNPMVGQTGVGGTNRTVSPSIQ